MQIIFSHKIQRSREHKESAGTCQHHSHDSEEEEEEDDEDDFTEENAVNLVVLDEVSASGAGKGYCEWTAFDMIQFA